MILEACSLGFIFGITAYVLSIMRYAVPIVLIIFVTIDVAKLVINPDEKNKKENMNRIGKRLLYAVIIFLIPTLVKIIFNSLEENNPGNYGNDNSATSWISCFNEYFK